jgi:hypothetical protein
VRAKTRGFCACATLAVALLSVPARADATKEQCADSDVKAQDLRRDGKLSAAREKLRLCAAQSCPPIVRDDCTKRLDDLEKAQPTLIFEARDGAGNDLSAVKVTVDGLPFADRLAGAPLRVDPGEHTFTFEVAGQPTLQKKIVVRENEQGRRESVVLGPAAQSPVGSPETPSSSSRPGAQKILAVVAGAVGVVGVGLGSAFGLIALSKKNDAQNACPDQCKDPSGVSQWSDAKSAGNVSTVAFVVGGVALAAGAVLWLTAPSSTPGPSAQVGVGPGVLQVAGVW